MTATNCLTRDKFFGELKPEFKEVVLPELGGSVFVRKMNAHERALYEGSVWDKNGNKISKVAQTYRERLAVLTVCDEQGNQLFTSGDIERLGKLPNTVLAAISDAALALCGIGVKKDDDEGNSSAQADS
jgi:hypothetical protein